MNESATNGADCSRKVAGDIRSLVKAGDSQLKCARLLYEILLVPVLIYGNGTILWKEKEVFRIRAVQMDRLLGGWIESRMNG